MIMLGKNHSCLQGQQYLKDFSLCKEVRRFRGCVIKKSRIPLRTSLTDTSLDRRSPAPIPVENGPVAHSSALLRSLLFLLNILSIMDEILQLCLGLVLGLCLVLDVFNTGLVGVDLAPDPRADEAGVAVAGGGAGVSLLGLFFRGGRGAAPAPVSPVVGTDKGLQGGKK